MPAMVPAIWGAKAQQLEYLQTKCKESQGRLSWTAISAGPLFDWMFTFEKGEFARVDFQRKKVEVLDGGVKMISGTNTKQVGKAVARTLLKEEETKNKSLLVQSFRFSQMDLVEALGKVTGDKWEVVKVESKKYFEENLGKAKEGDARAMFNVLWGVCATDTDWEDGSRSRKERFANGLLGLEEEDFEGSLREAVAKM